jgi:tRNA A-37 threonylcarbamoyl transferase component Bud32
MQASERRKWPRKVYKEPVLAVIHEAKGHAVGNDLQLPLYVGVHDASEGGYLIDTPQFLDKDVVLDFSLYDFTSSAWQNKVHRVAWVRPKESGAEYVAGLQTVENDLFSHRPLPSESAPGQQTLADTGFLLQTSLINATPRHAIWSLLNCIRPKSAEPGELLIQQGDQGDRLFIIQEGSCIVRVDKDGASHQVARLGKGDVVGEMAVLTGEPRYASVLADTGMKLWQLGKSEFEATAARHPELREFLTGLVSRRLESSTHTADRTIGKYLIKSKLGHGAWGIVYNGVHKALNMTVAIKMLKHQMAMDEEFSERFLREAKTIAKLNHKNIIHVYDVEELYQTLFIIMEYIEGESLDRILARQGPLPCDKAINYLMQICSGLAYAHERGIVHQDIKPDNIQLLADDQIKILDFGLACNVGSESFDMEGTVYYMAPEQIQSEPVDARTDIYNLGITAYELVTGRRPYPEDDLMALMDMHVDEDIPDPALLVPDMPEELRRFILRSCERDPEERYQSIKEAMGEIQPLYRGEAVAGKTGGRQKQRMTSLFFLYGDEQVGPMRQLLDEISGRAEELGVVMRAAEFKDV